MAIFTSGLGGKTLDHITEARETKVKVQAALKTLEEDPSIWNILDAQRLIATYRVHSKYAAENPRDYIVMELKLRSIAGRAFPSK